MNEANDIIGDIVALTEGNEAHIEGIIFDIKRFKTDLLSLNKRTRDDNNEIELCNDLISRLTRHIHGRKAENLQLSG